MLEAGTILRNRYRIQEALSGTDHPVYRADDTHTGQSVAIKAWMGLDVGQRRTLEEEVRQLSMLRHPSLADVREFFSEDEALFVVMEYIPGETLEEVLSRSGEELDGGLPPDQVLGWADDLLDALSYLHARQPPLVHGAIKPANIRLTQNNKVVLADVGVRPPGDAEGAPEPSPYIAPEQLMTGVPSVRGDLYSMAATLYHLLAGRAPRGARERAEMQQAEGRDPLLPLTELNPHVSQGLSDALARAMALEQAARPGSASALRAALRAARYLPSPSTPEATSETSLPEETVGTPETPVFEAEGAPPGGMEEEPYTTPTGANVEPPGEGEGRRWNRTCVLLGIGGGLLFLAIPCLCIVLLAAFGQDIGTAFEEIVETLETPTAGSEVDGELISVFDLEVGHCFDDPAGGLQVIEEVPLLPCDAPHDNEVFALLEYPGNGPFPSEEEMDTFADEQCTSAFAGYVGIDYLDSELYYWTITPTAETWEQGDREIICALYGADEEGNFIKLEGSMEGSGR